MQENFGDMGEMKIPLRPDAKPIKQQPYQLNPRYKEKIKAELGRIIDTGIVDHVEESEWIILIVEQGKRAIGEVRIFIDLSKLNGTCLHDPFSTPFTDDVLESVLGQ